jgi:hypothetical protein
MKLGPRLAGRPWTRADDEQLLGLLAAGLDRRSIARKLKRTVEMALNNGAMTEKTIS